MKFSITMKSPDCINDSVTRAAEDRADNDIASGLLDTNRDAMIRHNKQAIFEDIKKWITYKEYVTIDIDTIASTAVVREKL